MEKVSKKPVLYAAIIALTLLLSKKAHASRPYSWIDERGPKVELHINRTLIASAPKEKAEMVRSSLKKLEKAFSEQRRHYYYKITKHENETFAISLKDGEEILRITPDLAKYHKCSPRLLAGIWLTNIYEAHYGSKNKVEGSNYLTVTWYGGPKWNGKRTASGEVFYDWQLTAAFNDVPLNSLIRLSNSQNNRSVIVRVNDRCKKNGIVDVSKLAADLLGITRKGTAKLRVEILHSSK